MGHQTVLNQCFDAEELSFKLAEVDHLTVGQNDQEYRLEYWATRSSVRSFARTAHLFARSLTSLTTSLVGMIGWLFIVFFSILVHSVLHERVVHFIPFRPQFSRTL